MKIGSIASIFSVFKFKPESFAEIGKRFIERKITPAFCCSEVPKPLMKKFMRYIIFVLISVRQLAGVLLKSTGMQSSRRIFHRTAYIVPCRHLSLFYQGKFNTENAGIKSHHFG